MITEDVASLIHDVETKLFDRFDTWFYPGHGNNSAIGAERPTLPSGGNAAGSCPALALGAT